VTAKLSIAITTIAILSAVLFSGCGEQPGGNFKPVNSNGSNTAGNAAVNKVSFIIPGSTANKALEWQDVFKDGEKPATLREAAGKLERFALSNGKYKEIRIHGINGGFALVTSMQKFRLSDWLKTGDEEKATTAGNFVEYKDYLLKGKRSYYRFLIFSVTTDENPESPEVSVSFEDAKKWAQAKAAAASARSTTAESKDMLDVPLTEGYQLKAFIYVFEKNESSERPPILQRSGYGEGFENYLNTLFVK
jgi:hypothetical protein